MPVVPANATQCPNGSLWAFRFAVLCAIAVGACTNVSDFRGPWNGPRVGTAAVLHVGVPATTAAALTINSIDTYGLSGQLSIAGVITDATMTSVPGAEADALADLSMPDHSLRVYIAFVEVDDALGDATVILSFYEGNRAELRVMRGGSAPIYAVFTLSPGAAP